MLAFAPLASAALASSGDANTRVLYLASTEPADATAFVIEVSGTASLAATDAVDVSDTIVGVASFVNLDAIEFADIAASVVQNINIYLDGREATDVAAIACSMTGMLSVSATETPDAYAQDGYILWLEPDEPDDPSIWVPKNDPAQYLTTVI